MYYNYLRQQRRKALARQEIEEMMIKYELESHLIERYWVDREGNRITEEEAKVLYAKENT